MRQRVMHEWVHEKEPIQERGRELLTHQKTYFARLSAPPSCLGWRTRLLSCYPGLGGSHPM